MFWLSTEAKKLVPGMPQTSFLPKLAGVGEIKL